MSVCQLNCLSWVSITISVWLFQTFVSFHFTHISICIYNLQLFTLSSTCFMTTWFNTTNNKINKIKHSSITTTSMPPSPWTANYFQKQYNFVMHLKSIFNGGDNVAHDRSTRSAVHIVKQCGSNKLSIKSQRRYRWKWTEEIVATQQKYILII